MRYLHATGASFFFIFCYWHIGKALFYESYHFVKVWISGTLIVLILILSAFLGYVLPWGQISFWGATVITNLISVIPIIGQFLVEWVWGGFNVDEPTLNRFFSLHFIFPFVLLVLVLAHLFFLHEKGSSNPLGCNLQLDKIEFCSYFLIKDLITTILFIFFLLFFSLKLPIFFIDSENFLFANPMSTPIHIQPEWYFLFAYSILRSIPRKLGGVIILVLSILIILILPVLDKKKIKTKRFFLHKIFILHFHFGSFFILTWLGIIPVELPFTLLGKIYSVFYFAFYFI